MNRLALLSARLAILLSVVLAYSVSTGCAGQGIRGSLQDGAYTSPTRTFAITVPQLLDPGSVIKDGMEAPDNTWVMFTDDLCRQYFVDERIETNPDQPIEQWVDERMAPYIIDTSAVIHDRSIIEFRYGRTVRLHYTVPGGGPCISITMSDGTVTKKQSDGEFAEYVFRYNGHIYRLVYVVGTPAPLESTDWLRVKRTPLWALHDHFVQGFRGLGTRD